MTTGYAVVKEVLSGDTLVLMGRPQGGPPPERQITLASIVAPRVAMKSSTYEVPDEPFGWNAREFLRRLAVGNSVQYSIDNTTTGREYGSVTLNNQDLGLLVVQNGWGTVAGPKSANTGAKNLQELRNAEAAAKEAKLGMWCDDLVKSRDSIRTIKWISNDAPATTAFVNTHKNKQLPAVIEFVRDAGFYRVYFPEQSVAASLQLSGLQAERFRRIEGSDAMDADPFAREGKYFAESRVLNRDLHIRIEGADTFGNLYGSFIHPKGNLSALLLSNGFAKINERSIGYTESPSLLREAQREAQEKRLRRWMAYQPQTLDVPTEYFGRVVEIVSGDSLSVVEWRDGAPAEEERRLYLASIRAPRLGTRSRAEEPWAYDAKEFVRKSLIGKKVKVIVVSTRTPNASATGAALPPASDSTGRMHFVTILYDKNRNNIAEELVARGLATVTKDYRPDDPLPANFDVLMAKSAEAAAKKLGLHGAQPPKHRVNDISGRSNSTVAKNFEASLKRAGKMEGVIEHVMNGGRFRVRIPKESLLISFALSGIRCPMSSRGTGAPASNTAPAAGEDFGDEALQFSRHQYLQRDITLSVEACDAHGTFIGIAWHGQECINVALVSNGLAELRYRNTSHIAGELEAAQKIAAEQRLGIWSLKSPDDGDNPVALCEEGDLNDPVDRQSASPTPLRSEVLPQVAFLCANGVSEVFLKLPGGSDPSVLNQAIDAHIARPQPKTTDLGSKHEFGMEGPKKGDIVLCLIPKDNKWHRARVGSTNLKKKDVEVFGLDDPFATKVPGSSLRRCPQGLMPSSMHPATIRCCQLAGLKPPIDMEAEGAQELNEIMRQQRNYRCVVESVDPVTGKHIVQLFPLEATDSVNGQQGELAALIDHDTLGEPHVVTPGGTNASAAASEEALQPIIVINPPAAGSISLNEELAKQGLAMLDTRSPTELRDALKAAETHARKAHLNLWRYGDVDDGDSDGENGAFPRLGAKGRRGRGSARFR